MGRLCTALTAVILSGLVGATSASAALSNDGRVTIEYSGKLAQSYVADPSNPALQQGQVTFTWDETATFALSGRAEHTANQPPGLLVVDRERRPHGNAGAPKSGRELQCHLLAPARRSKPDQRVLFKQCSRSHGDNAGCRDLRAELGIPVRLALLCAAYRRPGLPLSGQREPGV